jgi:hypothetical protein
VTFDPATGEAAGAAPAALRPIHEEEGFLLPPANAVAVAASMTASAMTAVLNIEALLVGAAPRSSFSGVTPKPPL